ncbi:pyruvate kinase [Patescibacteria group bacterium]|nr:pyruvate kinase [Patescibacteria group bacterium]
MDIIATIWKAPYYYDRNQRMIDAGVNYFRIKCSHISADEIIHSLQAARKQIRQSKKEVQLLADLPEAKIRLGEFPQEKIDLKKDGQYVFKKELNSPNPLEFIPIKYENIGSHLIVGDEFYVGDGQLSFEVVEISNVNEFVARANNSGKLIFRSSITIPKMMDEINHITPFLDEIIPRLPEVQPEMVAFSFVSSKEMLEELISKLSKYTSPTWQPKIIAKIESRAGVENIDEILEMVDGIMVARGDLALTMPYAELGLTQKKLVSKARNAEKYVIVATQALQSLLDNFLPMRSDILDITNMCLDGASAVMLCAETAHSEHPERAVEVAKEIISAVESSK